MTQVRNVLAVAAVLLLLTLTLPIVAAAGGSFHTEQVNISAINPPTVKHGPSLPPDPWEELRLAQGQRIGLTPAVQLDCARHIGAPRLINDAGFVTERYGDTTYLEVHTSPHPAAHVFQQAVKSVLTSRRWQFQ